MKKVALDFVFRDRLGNVFGDQADRRSVFLGSATVPDLAPDDVRELFHGLCPRILFKTPDLNLDRATIHDGNDVHRPVSECWPRTSIMDACTGEQTDDLRNN